MKSQMTLWDWIEPVVRVFAPAKPPAPTPPSAPAPKRPPSQPRRRAQAGKRPAEAGRPSRARALIAVSDTNGTVGAPDSMQSRYDRVVREMLEKHQIRVRRWRAGMCGIAWYVTYRDGRRQNLIEAPRPRGPMSAAVFLHEIGHHAIGFNVYRPRCLEEYHAWRWALEAMEAHGLNITEAVRHRMRMSLWYAVSKAKRRGIRRIPEELAPYLEKPKKRKQRVATEVD